MLKRTISLTVCCFLLGGCATSLDQNMGKIGGTALGAAGGAALGNKMGGNKGAVIGGVLGGLLGYTIGDAIDKRREELKKIAEQEQMEIYFSDIKSSEVVYNETNNPTLSSSKDTLATKQQQEEEQKKVGDKVIITETNQFAKGSSDLTSKARESFTKISKIYSQSNKKILIIGHTDDSGSSSLNQKLSEERAKTLGKVFAENGVKQENIYFLGAGEMQPIADNNIAEGASKNRRVEIIELSNEQEIALYSNLRKTNPSFFKPVEIKQKSKEKVDIVASTLKNTPTETTKKTESISAPQETQQPQETPSVNLKFVDFGGTKSNNKNLFSLDKLGEVATKESFIGIGTKAKADTPSNLYGNCATDKPRVYGETKSLASGEKIDHKTFEYKNGLNQSSWTTSINKHLVGLAPVGVVRDGSKPVSSPKIYIYENYIQNSNAKPNETLSTTINAYQGNKGLLYRVFISDDDSSLKCMDIIFDEKNVNASTGKMYYATKNGMYEKEFTMQEVGRN